MSDRLSYQQAGGSLGAVADWLLNQIATYGLLTVIAAGTVAIVALLCGIGALCQAIGHLRDRRHKRHGIRRLEQYANHPNSRAALDHFHQARKEKPQP